MSGFDFRRKMSKCVLHHKETLNFSASFIKGNIFVIPGRRKPSSY